MKNETQSECVSLEDIQKVLRYEPETGHFYWLVRQGRQGAGTRAGALLPCGHRQIRVCKKMHRANRLAWAFMTGAFPPPDMLVDHENRKTGDDRWENLRLASNADNTANQSIRPDNTSGYPGVHFFKRTGRYSAYIQRNGKMQFLGYYATKSEAIAVRKAATERVFGAFAPNHGEPIDGHDPQSRPRSAGLQLEGRPPADPSAGRGCGPGSGNADG